MPDQPPIIDSEGLSADGERGDGASGASGFKKLAVLWMESQTAIAAFIWSSVGDYQDAEDVMQQVAVEVAEHFERYDQGQPFLPWAMAIARFRVIDYYRKYKRNRLVFSGEALEQIASVAAEPGAKGGGETAEALDRCMKRLSPKTRRLIEMRYLSDMKPQDIASRIGTTANTVSVALSRTRTRLVDCVRNQLGRGKGAS